MLAGVATTLPIKDFQMLLVYVQVMPSIAPKRVNNITQTDIGWMQSIVDYLRTGEVLKNRKQTH